jgi:zinc protease
MALGVIVAACAHTPAPQLTFDPREPFRYTLDVDVFRLQNGLTVVLSPQPAANVVAIDARYEVGSADDPAGKSGLAHLVEHVIPSVTARPGEPTLRQRTRAATYRYNAWTTYDATDYSGEAMSDQLSELLRIEAARMSSSCEQISDTELEHDRAVVAQETLERRQDANEPVFAALFGTGHPYARSVLGTDLAALTRADVCAFIDAHYAPDRAILVVSGNFDVRTTKDAIAGDFAGMRRRGVPRATIPSITTPGDAIAEVRGNWDQPWLLLAVPAPALGTRDAVAARLCRERLWTALRAFDLSRADVVYTDVYGFGDRADGALVLAVALADNANASEVRSALQTMLEQLANAPDRDFDSNRADVARRLLFEFDDLWTRGPMIADYMQFTGDASLHAVDLQRLTKVVPADVRSYLRDHIVHAQKAIVHVVPGGGADPPASIRDIRVAATDDATADGPVDEAEADRALAMPPAVHGAFDEIRLANGLRVIFAPRPGSSLFSARLTFPAGIADEPADHPGDARLALFALGFNWQNMLMTSAIRTFPQAASHAGTGWRRGVGAHETSFTVTGPASFADWHLWSLSTMFTGGGYYNPSVVADYVRDDLPSPYRARNSEMLRALFGADDLLAKDSQQAKVIVADLDGFKALHYRASGATLVIAGGFDRARIEGVIHALWDTWPTTPASTRPAPAAAPPAASALVVLATDDSTTTQVRVRVDVRARSSGDDAGLRLVAAKMVFARLRAVREQLGASYEVNARYRSDLSGDVLEIEGEVSAAQAGVAIARILRELGELHDHAATFRADFVRARRAALASAMASDGSAEDAIEESEGIVSRGLPLARLSEIPREIAAVRPADVGALLAGDLDPARMVVQIAGPGAVAAATAAGLKVNQP